MTGIAVALIEALDATRQRTRVCRSETVLRGVSVA